MPSARKWMSGLLLRAPAPFRSLRDLPVLGDFIHRVSLRILPADKMVWAQIEDGPAQGIWLELNPRTGQGYWRGDAECAVQKILAERLRPGMIFYDLGANIGLFSLLAARLVGKSGKVFSFEPDAQIAERLRRNASRNGFANVEIVEAGIWSASGNMSFIVADSSSPDRGIGRLATSENEASGELTRCVALDDFIRTAPAPDAIKCDVEGAEVEAIRGAEQLLKTRRPWIVCEMHSAANDQALRSYLAYLGYTFETVDANHLLALPREEG
ncbi:MAG: FkbM family methyltransferase [Candidatus Acidiferrales bacterium]